MKAEKKERLVLGLYLGLQGVYFTLLHEVKAQPWYCLDFQVILQLLSLMFVDRLVVRDHFRL